MWQLQDLYFISFFSGADILLWRWSGDFPDTVVSDHKYHDEHGPSGDKADSWQRTGDDLLCDFPDRKDPGASDRTDQYDRDFLSDKTQRTVKQKSVGKAVLAGGGVAGVFFLGCQMGTPLFVWLFYHDLFPSIKGLVTVVNLAQVLGLFSAFLFILVLTFTDEKWQLWIQLAHFVILLTQSVAGSKKLWDDRICLGMPGSKYASGCGSDRTGDLEGKTGEERRRMKRCRQVKFLEEWCSIFWMLQKAVS